MFLLVPSQIYSPDHSSNNFSSSPSTPVGSPQALAGLCRVLGEGARAGDCSPRWVGSWTDHLLQLMFPWLSPRLSRRAAWRRGISGLKTGQSWEGVFHALQALKRQRDPSEAWGAQEPEQTWAFWRLFSPTVVS